MFQIGQNKLELNPYWKDGGTGLPEEAKKVVPAAKGMAGDGGLAWWQKAHQRCVEQAKEEGRSLEQVASDRYGVGFYKVKVYVFKATSKILKLYVMIYRPMLARNENLISVNLLCYCEAYF